MKQSFFGGLIALGLSAQSAGAEDDRAAWIENDRTADSITLQARARLADGESGRYSLTVRKSGQSGSSTTRQAGQIPAGNGETATGPLMTSRLSFRSGETLEAELVVETSTGRELRDVLTLTNSR